MHPFKRSSAEPHEAANYFFFSPLGALSLRSDSFFFCPGAEADAPIFGPLVEDFTFPSGPCAVALAPPLPLALLLTCPLPWLEEWALAPPPLLELLALTPPLPLWIVTVCAVATAELPASSAPQAIHRFSLFILLSPMHAMAVRAERELPCSEPQRYLGCYFFC